METKCYILQLPNEILSLIFQYLFTSQGPRGGPAEGPHRIRDLASLPLVCKRIARLAKPLLYDKLQICHQPFCRGKIQCSLTSGQLLHRALKSNKEVHRYCRRLEMTIGPGVDSVLMATDLTRWLTEITELNILSFSELFDLNKVTGKNVLRLRKNVLGGFLANAPKLRAITLRELTHDFIDLHQFLEPPVCCFKEAFSLQSLTLCNISERSKPTDLATLNSCVGTGSLTELCLIGFLQSLEVLQKLVEWPKSLTRFEFNIAYPDVHRSRCRYKDWSLRDIGWVLRGHQNTLTHITISSLFHSRLEGFDVSGFQLLESLEISSSATGTDTQLIHNLLPPSLRSFCWDMRLVGGQCMYERSRFGDADEQWLSVLLKAAAERGINLEKLTVRFTIPHKLSDDCVRKGHGSKGVKNCPWSRIYQLSQQFKPRMYYSRELVAGPEESYPPGLFDHPPGELLRWLWDH